MGWWARQDLNLGPTDYESAALTAELRAPRTYKILYRIESMEIRHLKGDQLRHTGARFGVGWRH